MLPTQRLVFLVSLFAISGSRVVSSFSLLVGLFYTRVCQIYNCGNFAMKWPRNTNLTGDLNNYLKWWVTKVQSKSLKGIQFSKNENMSAKRTNTISFEKCFAVMFRIGFSGEFVSDFLFTCVDFLSNFWRVFNPPTITMSKRTNCLSYQKYFTDMFRMLTMNYSFWGLMVLIIHFYTVNLTEVSFLVDFGRFWAIKCWWDLSWLVCQS